MKLREDSDKKRRNALTSTPPSIHHIMLKSAIVLLQRKLYAVREKVWLHYLAVYRSLTISQSTMSHSLLRASARRFW